MDRSNSQAQLEYSLLHTYKQATRYTCR